MRIISTFHDYYDVGLGLGIDENLRYVRETSVTPYDGYADDVEGWRFEVPFDKDRQRAVITSILIGFAGTLYPCVRIVTEKAIHERDTVQYTLQTKQHFYEADAAIRFLQKHQIPLEPDSHHWHGGLDTVFRAFFECTHYPALREALQTTPCFAIETVERFYIENGGENTDDREWYGYNMTWTVNPILARFDFITVKEPMQAFQALSVYLGTQTREEDRRITIDDRDLAQAKGFDDNSFKKRPGKKRKKRG